MISLLLAVGPALLGLLTSFLPNLIKYLERGQEYKHEMELIRLKMEAAAQGLDHELIVASLKATVDEGKSLRDHDSGLDGSKWINDLRAAIRPFLTIFFFLFFVGIKVTVAWIMIQNGAPPELILAAIWDQYTNAIFGAVMGFYFGTRAMMHTMEQYRKQETK